MTSDRKSTASEGDGARLLPDESPETSAGSATPGQARFSDDTIPLRNDTERREAEERDARLRLLIPETRR